MACMMTLNIVAAHADRTITVDKPRISYYASATELTFDISYDEITEKVGIFHQYAERFLGTEATIKEDNHYYRLSQIVPTLSSAADTSVMVTLTEKFLKDNLISIDNNNCLTGINLTELAPQVSDALPAYKAEELLPIEKPFALHEEQLLAGSMSKMAEGTAKSIYRLREARLNLLQGELENMPSDVAAIEIMLRQINEQEQQLTAMFLGSRTITTHTKRITYLPRLKEENVVLFRFSKQHGLIDKDNLIAEPYYIDVKAETTNIVNKTGEPYQLAKEDVVVYTEPADCRITITDFANNKLLDFKCKMAQFGQRLTLPDILIRRKAKVSINAQTGQIIYIAK